MGADDRRAHAVPALSSCITTKGGSKSHVSKWIDKELLIYDWIEKKFDTKIRVDNVENPSPTHGVVSLFILHFTGTFIPVSITAKWGNAVR
jgi:hypothetical protein